MAAVQPTLLLAPLYSEGMTLARVCNPHTKPAHLQARREVCAARHRLQHQGALLLPLLRRLLEVRQHALGCRVGWVKWAGGRSARVGTAAQTEAGS